MSKVKPIKKLVTLPSYVWQDVSAYVMKKYHILLPKHNFDISKFIYSTAFDYKKFVVQISEKQAMLLFTLICKKLGVAFIPDSQGWKVVTLEETADQLLEYAKRIVVDAEEVEQDH